MTEQTTLGQLTQTILLQSSARAIEAGDDEATFEG
jgi:hypothetical protein